MTSDALQILTEHAEYAALLQAYERAQADLTENDADDDGAGWVPRLVDVPGVDDARLAPMHGKLIAHGLLSFQLTGRTSGVVYRVSADGRDALRQLAARPAGPAEDDALSDVAA